MVTTTSPARETRRRVMISLANRWAGWAAAYLAASGLALYAVVKLAGVFDDAVRIADARADLIDELNDERGLADTA